MYHSAAVAVIDGAAGEKQYGDARVRDPVVVALRDKVTATAEKNIREDEAHITVALRDGRRLDNHVHHAIGSLERPMTDADLEAKFRGLAAGILPTPQVDKLIQACWSLAQLDDAGVVARAAARPA